MSLVVGVHGIGQQRKGEDVLQAEWGPWLLSGLRRAGESGERARVLLTSDPALPALRCVFYGDLFRPAGRSLAVGDPFLTADDITEDEAHLLQEWWGEAARTDAKVPSPDTTALSTPRTVQRGLNALSRSRFWAGVGERGMLFDLRQVRLYLNDPKVRGAVQERVTRTVTPSTRVLVGHSLGSVVAYEALCAHPEWTVDTLITLGSPLGIRNLIFDKLTPAPEPFPASGTSPGHWPGSIRTWINVADDGDVVALVKDLQPLFGRGLAADRSLGGRMVDNGASAHDVGPYLTAQETGEALAAGLTGQQRGSADGGGDRTP